MIDYKNKHLLTIFSREELRLINPVFYKQEFSELYDKVIELFKQVLKIDNTKEIDELIISTIENRKYPDINVETCFVMTVQGLKVDLNTLYQYIKQKGDEAN